MTFYNFALGVFRVFSKVFFKFEVIGYENIPTEGNLLIAANHKSNFDPVLVAAAVNKRRKMSAVAKEELFKNPILRAILTKVEIIPVNRDNPGLKTIKTILKYIKEQYAIVIFPEGTRYKGDEFGEAKSGLSLFAVKGKAMITPCTIVSSYKPFSKVIIYFDKPVCLDEYYGKKLTGEDHDRISQDVMEIIKANYFKYKEA